MDFTTGSEVPADDVVAEPRTSKTVDAKAHAVVTDDSRDALLTEFGKDTLRDRYLLPGENFQDLFARVASAYADDGAHAQRVYDYISKLWFMPATPVLSNGGTGRGLPISCYLNSVSDSLDGIVGTWNENVWLASKGGGIGTYWGSVRGIGEPVGLNGKTSGIIPFVRVMDSLTLAISARARCAAARPPSTSTSRTPRSRSSSRSASRRATSTARRSTSTTACSSPTSSWKRCATATSSSCAAPRTARSAARSTPARLFQKLVETRLATGEPYIIFIDAVNKSMPKHHRDLGLKVTTSNLCSEITLPTGKDHLGADRTAVCCLSSLNLETWDQWNGDKTFIEDVMRFLDNVLSDYIARAPDEMARAKYSAERERSVGLGVMGFHSFLQARGLPFEGAMAKSWNLKIFKHIRAQVDEASMMLANERGPCPDAADMGVMERFSCKMAIAPTASISIIAGGTSACIEPIPGNVYTHKTLSGSFSIKNPHLEKLLEEKVKDSPRSGTRSSSTAARSSTSTS